MLAPNTILESAYQYDTTPTHEDVFRAFEMVKPEDVYRFIVADKLTNELIQQLDLQFSNIVFVAWGGSAQKITESVTNNIVLTSSHPSPLSANRGKEPFMKSHIFKQINDSF